MKWNSTIIGVPPNTPVVEKSKIEFGLLIECIVQKIIKHVY
jgi:hypothetical protein